MGNGVCDTPAPQATPSARDAGEAFAQAYGGECGPDWCRIPGLHAGIGGSVPCWQTDGEYGTDTADTCYPDNHSGGN